MKKIAFHISNFSFRGTEIATFDYSYYNKHFLKNKSYICCFKSCFTNPDFNELALKKFSNEFKINIFENILEYNKFLLENKIQFIYIIKYGLKNDEIPFSIPTFIHCLHHNL